MAITNGGFETGDLTGWTESADDWQVTTDLTHGGTYAAKATPSGYGSWTLQQTIDVTDIASVKGYFDISSYTLTGIGLLQLQISLYTATGWSLFLGHLHNATYTEDNLPPSGWVEVSYDTSLLSGNVILYVYIFTYSEEGGES